MPTLFPLFQQSTRWKMFEWKFPLLSENPIMLCWTVIMTWKATVYIPLNGTKAGESSTGKGWMQRFWAKNFLKSNFFPNTLYRYSPKENPAMKTFPIAGVHIVVSLIKSYECWSAINTWHLIFNSNESPTKAKLSFPAQRPQLLGSFRVKFLQTRPRFTR